MRKALATGRLLDTYRRIAWRYDLQHAALTLGADGRGRRMLVERTVKAGDAVLDCGAGTGATGILAARRAGPEGHVTLFDLSEAMLEVARQKAARAGLGERLTFEAGDMARLPYEDGSFDVVLSSYSLCPLHDPAQGATEMFRVARPGGLIGAAHSAEPASRPVRWLAEKVENLAWRFPGLSMGCRPVSVLPALQAAGARLVFSRVIGFPLWPFLVFVAEKPEA
ncbi:MAG: methyltransferase domain-containing protein [Paracoccaceae bacterium]